MISRRYFTVVAGCSVLATSFASAQSVSILPTDLTKRNAAIQNRLQHLEATSQGRLGVHILDTGTSQEYGHRSDERFMMLSSFKLLASALVLHRVDAGKESLERRLRYTAKDLIPGSPVTEQHTDGSGMTLAQLCEATITTSDNTAGNLILSSYGGPAAFTAFARQLGDNVSRLDRNEPTLNAPTVEGVMDTTSPRAMVTVMHKVLLGNVLSSESRSLLQQWLRGNTTGTHRLKAGLPTYWHIGDKTGTNKTDSNDIAIIYPSNRPPLLVTAYLADSQASSQVKDSTIAAVGKLVHDIAS
jgi:beta-lactamase class A